MTEVLFYHLQNRSLEQALPPLLEKCLARGWRAVVQASSAERIEALDAHLWTFSDESFLPHGRDGEAEVAAQPIVLTLHAGNPNSADVRFLVDGAAVDDVRAYVRAVFIFDGRDAEAVAEARGQWMAMKSAGHDVTYWQQDENGRWLQKA